MTECPSSNQMRAFLADALDASATAATEAHVEACSRCQNELDRLTRGIGPTEQPPPGGGSAAEFLRRLERNAPSIAPATPPPPDVRGIADRNLLFGVLAMQVDLIEAGQFAEVCSAWATRKHVPLADLMVERGWLTPADKGEVERLLVRKLKRHKGDVQAGLAEVANPDVVRSLADVHDAEIHRSLAALPPAAGRVFLSTTNFELGTRERYSLSRLHARGGIGRVWLAQDVDLGREVALKELLPGQANHPQACARFLAEAKITGQLEHPGIVPVYELSRRPDGQEPFYTMRFIKGRTLTEASKEYHVRRAAGQATAMDLRELLSAFVAVSYAVAYAHSRGVIHRDLKGQNVILGKYGEVIVLDWGLAKVIGSSDDERDNKSVTASLPVALASGDSHDETIQGQVMGTPAYMAPEQALGRQDLVDQRTDVYGLGAVLYEIFAGTAPFSGGETRDLLHRIVNEAPASPRQHVPGTAPALEAICLKAMEKKPTDRYSSARALGQDVQKFLADEPVSAYPERWTVSLSRWSRRHRSLVGGAAALLIVGVAALTVSTILLGQANRRTQEQRDEAERHRRDAETNLSLARAAVDESFTTVSEDVLLSSPLPGLQPLRRQLLQSSLKYYQEFARRNADDLSVRSDLAAALTRTGEITAEVGSPDEAMRDLQQAADLYSKLAESEPSAWAHQAGRGRCLARMGKLEGNRGRSAEAISYYTDAIALLDKVVRDHPESETARADLGFAHHYLALRMSARRDTSARQLEHERHHQRAIELRKRLADDRPDHIGYATDLSQSLTNYSYYLYLGGKSAEALASVRQSNALQRDLVRNHPHNPQLQYRLSLSTRGIGILLKNLGQWDAGLPYYRESVTIMQKVVEENPAVTEYRLVLATSRAEFGQELVDRGDVIAALEEFARAQEQAKAVASKDPKNYQNLNNLASIHRGRGKARAKQSKHAEALDEFGQAVTIGEKIAGEGSLYRYDLACSLALCAESAANFPAGLPGGGPKEAGRYADRAMEVLRQAVSDGWKDVDGMSRDPDLNSLRTRADLKKLIADLKTPVTKK